MIDEVRSEEVERFRSAISKRLGLAFDGSKIGELAEVLRKRVSGSSVPASAYIARIESGEPEEELFALAKDLTVGETYFFRHLEQFRALSESVLPERMSAARARGRELRVLSAGCSSGDEPYSIAILLREGFGESVRAGVVGVDLNSAALERASSGSYSAWALRETPSDIRRRYFHADGQSFALDRSIVSSVKLRKINLADDDPLFWQAESFDVIFCRNVLMYLVPGAARALVDRISRALAPGGYLFLGHAENLRGLSNDFHLVHAHGAFYYQRKPGGHAATQAYGSAVSAWSPPPAPGARSASWVETISDSARKVAVLTDAGKAAEPCRGREPAGPYSLADVLELFRMERYSEALASLEALPAEASRDPDVMLLEALLLTQQGQLSAAEECCRKLIEIDELSAGAYYVAALCREGLGDLAGAIQRHQIAVYLDPGFAMPRLHGGLLALRSGNHEDARRELDLALTLLRQEEANRLLLFGGGFTRDALLSLCKAKLASCGGGA